MAYVVFAENQLRARDRLLALQFEEEIGASANWLEDTLGCRIQLNESALSEDEVVSVELYQPGWVTRVGLPLAASRSDIRRRAEAALHSRRAR
ncbi:MAG: hypothetical protein DMF80_09160 [Acidobacteria bacterium]|nr:MAG: hypothetical protein DMF80_09160 [Acidobacteriota bacterium]PYQ20848.1 MAG: hypothetical protein DMF81_17345 [Acidobacteriota bacterium]